ncbi:MAG: rhodanese-like domain-containing protein [Myxococcales bacterium]|nr:rhodanese-like domain-containing protein [Myxococcales bacterium]
MIRALTLLALLVTLPACSKGEPKPAAAPAPAAGGSAAAAQPADPVAAVLQQDGRKLIDVRTPGEFAAGHVPGSINIPVNQMADIEAAIGGKDQPAVLFCASGRRSGMALTALKAKGYTNLVNGGGFQQFAAKLGVQIER